MSSISRTLLVPASLLLAACADTGPAAPTADMHAGPAAEAAEVSTSSGVFEIEGEYYLDCVDEIIRETFRAPFTTRLIVNPKGGHTYLEPFDPMQATGTIVGLTSGHTWTHTRVVSPYVDRGGAGGMTHFIFRSTLVSETGPTLELRHLFHVTTDANGELRVDRLNLRCFVR